MPNSGAIAGGVAGVKQARANGVNPWTGKSATRQEYVESVDGIKFSRKVGYGDPVEEIQVKGIDESRSTGASRASMLPI